MAQVIVSFSASPEDAPTVTKIEKIAKRQRRSRSFVVLEALRDYVEKDKLDNGERKLEHFPSTEATGYPSAWQPLGTKELARFTWKEDDDMIAKLESALANVKNDRQAKRDVELAAKTGEKYAKGVPTTQPR